MSGQIDWSKDYVLKDCALSISEFKQNYNMTFHKDGKQIGAMDWNGPEMTFVGDVDESAKVFFDWIAQAFKGRLEQERAEEREACARVVEAYTGAWDDQGFALAAAIRARGQK